MTRKLSTVCVSLVILTSLQLSTSFPLFSGFPYHNNRNEFKGINHQEQSESKSTSLETKGLPWVTMRVKRSTHGHIDKNKAHVSTGRARHLRLASKDQRIYKPTSEKENKSQTVTALSIFGGCAAFIALVVAVACVWYRRKENKRIKKATHVEVEYRNENVPHEVSMITDAHIDVGQHWMRKPKSQNG